jgi:uncharacterized protein (UPF0332 family)
LFDAKFAFEAGRLKNSVNRSYYAMFNAVRALLTFDKVDFKRHSTLISYFNQHYIATGKIEKQYHTMLVNAFEIRQQSDYNDFYVVSRDEAKIQLDNSVKFIELLKKSWLIFE